MDLNHNQLNAEIEQKSDQEVIKLKERLRYIEDTNIELRAKLVFFQNEEDMKMQNNVEFNHLHNQLKHKDDKIVELNDLILEKERQIIDLQELCKDQGQVEQSRKIALKIVNKRLQALEKKKVCDVSTETDCCIVSDDKDCTKFNALDQNKRCKSPKRAYRFSSTTKIRTPPPIDPSEINYLTDKDVCEILNPIQQKSLFNGRKRVTFANSDSIEDQLSLTTEKALNNLSKSFNDEKLKKTVDYNELVTENENLRKIIVTLEENLANSSVNEKLSKNDSCLEKADEKIKIQKRQLDVQNQILKARANAQFKIRELEESLLNLKTKSSSEIDSLKATNQTLIESRDWLIDENANLVKDNEKLKTKVNDLLGELDASIATNTLFRNRLEDSEKKIESLGNELIEVRRILHQTNDTKQYLQNEVNRLKDSISEQDELISVLEGDLVVYEAHVGILKDSLGASKMKDRKSIKSKAYVAKINALEIENQEIVKRHNDERLKTKALNVKICCLEQERDRLLQQLGILEQKCDSTNLPTHLDNLNEKSYLKNLSPVNLNNSDYLLEDKLQNVNTKMLTESSYLKVIQPQALSAFTITNSNINFTNENLKIQNNILNNFNNSNIPMQTALFTSINQTQKLPLSNHMEKNKDTLFKSIDFIENNQTNQLNTTKNLLDNGDIKNSYKKPDKNLIDFDKNLLNISFENDKNNLFIKEQQINELKNDYENIKLLNFQLENKFIHTNKRLIKTKEKILSYILLNFSNTIDCNKEDSEDMLLDKLFETVFIMKDNILTLKSEVEKKQLDFEELELCLELLKKTNKNLENENNELQISNKTMLFEKQSAENNYQEAKKALEENTRYLLEKEQMLLDSINKVKDLQTSLDKELNNSSLIFLAKKDLEFRLEEINKQLLDEIVYKENLEQQLQLLKEDNACLSLNLAREKERLERFVDLLRHEVDRFRMEAELSRNCLNDLKQNSFFNQSQQLENSNQFDNISQNNYQLVNNQNDFYCCNEDKKITNLISNNYTAEKVDNIKNLNQFEISKLDEFVQCSPNFSNNELVEEKKVVNDNSIDNFNPSYCVQQMNVNENDTETKFILPLQKNKNCDIITDKNLDKNCIEKNTNELKKICTLNLENNYSNTFVNLNVNIKNCINISESKTIYFNEINKDSYIFNVKSEVKNEILNDEKFNLIFQKTLNENNNYVDNLLTTVNQLLKLNSDLEATVDLLKTEICELNSQLHMQIIKFDQVTIQLQECKTNLSKSNEESNKNDQTIKILQKELDQANMFVKEAVAEKKKIEEKVILLEQKCYNFQQKLLLNEKMLEEFDNIKKLNIQIETQNVLLNKDKIEQNILIENLKTDFSKKEDELMNFQMENLEISAELQKLKNQLLVLEKFEENLYDIKENKKNSTTSNSFVNNAKFSKEKKKKKNLTNLSSHANHSINLQLAILAARLETKSDDNSQLLQSNIELTQINAQLQATIKELEVKINEMFALNVNKFEGDSVQETNNNKKNIKNEKDIKPKLNNDVKSCNDFEKNLFDDFFKKNINNEVFFDSHLEKKNDEVKTQFSKPIQNLSFCKLDVKQNNCDNKHGKTFSCSINKDCTKNLSDKLISKKNESLYEIDNDKNTINVKKIKKNSENNCDCNLNLLKEKSFNNHNKTTNLNVENNQNESFSTQKQNIILQQNFNVKNDIIEKENSYSKKKMLDDNFQSNFLQKRCLNSTVYDHKIEENNTLLNRKRLFNLFQNVSAQESDWKIAAGFDVDEKIADLNDEISNYNNEQVTSPQEWDWNSNAGIDVDDKIADLNDEILNYNNEQVTSAQEWEWNSAAGIDVDDKIEDLNDEILNYNNEQVTSPQEWDKHSNAGIDVDDKIKDLNDEILNYNNEQVTSTQEWDWNSNAGIDVDDKIADLNDEILNYNNEQVTSAQEWDWNSNAGIDVDEKIEDLNDEILNYCNKQVTSAQEWDWNSNAGIDVDEKIEDLNDEILNYNNEQVSSTQEWDWNSIVDDYKIEEKNTLLNTESLSNHLQNTFAQEWDRNSNAEHIECESSNTNLKNVKSCKNLQKNSIQERDIKATNTLNIENIVHDSQLNKRSEMEIKNLWDWYN